MLWRCNQPYLIRNSLTIVSILIINLIGSPSNAQSGLSGRIYDSTLKKNCHQAVIAILTSDSTLLTFTRSKADGSFNIATIPAGSYRVIVTHPGYADFQTTLTIQNQPNLNLGNIALPPKAQYLAEVLVTAKEIPPKMKGDTLEYNTAHIKTRVNANVEELLNRLPGLQVDQNGVITINGQKIEKLLVNGEEFFGNDPILVTRNFNADLISKVQILDRKSDKTRFTGIEDGQTTKTLNLTIKEEKKKGYFGKLEAGGDTEGFYNAGALLGSFKQNRQLALLGMASNTGSTGFSGNVGSYGSGLSFASSAADPFGASAGAGIPRITAVGFHYADRWSPQNDHLLVDYNYGRISTDPVSSTIIRQILPGSIYNQQQTNTAHSLNEQHGLNARYDYSPDTLSTFNFLMAGTASQGSNDFHDTSSTSLNDTLVNTSTRKIKSETDNRDWQSSLMWRIRAKQNAKQVFSLALAIANQDHNANGMIFTKNIFFTPPNTDTIDQRKQIVNKSNTINTSANYALPLGKKTTLGLSYEFSSTKTNSTINTYDKGNGKYDLLVDSLSSKYINTTIANKATINLQSTGSKINYFLGGDLFNQYYKQDDKTKSISLTANYWMFVPRFFAGYHPNGDRSFEFRYDGRPQQPSLQQMQPYQNNNDPMHITLGNPDLKPGFTHNFLFDYRNLRPFMYYIQANYYFASSGISTKTYIDSLGRQISQAVNTSGFNSKALHLGFNKKIRPIDVDLGFRTFLAFTRNVNYINQYISNNDNYMTGGSIMLSKFTPDKYSIQLSASADYSYSKSSINQTAVTKFWTQTHNLTVMLLSVARMEIASGFTYIWRQKLDNFDQHNTVMRWNAYINKNICNNALSIRWQINDILNQNSGIFRDVSANQTTERTANVLGRYWMLSCIYHFTHQRTP